MKVEKKSVIIEIEAQNKTVVASHESTILDALIVAGIQIDHSCGGNGTCGTCRIEILHGIESFFPPNNIEKEMIEDRNMKEFERLACQSHCRGSIKIKI